MSFHLEDYAERLKELAPESWEVLHNNWPDATKSFSTRGLDNYIKAALALRTLGRGAGVVSAWLESAPQIAAQVGEDVIPELASTALGMASKTSGTVIESVLSSAPTAARRLGDASLFIKYLQFLSQLLSQAPRGIRPLLQQLDVLLGQLTLGGLRRWAMWGAHAHRTHYDEQVRYFGLESKESQAILQKERKGTLFVDIQRRINMYLRALWGRNFFMKPTSGDFETREGYRPYLADYFIHLPDAFDEFKPEGRAVVSGLELYRSAAAHAAAHLVYTRSPLSAQGLTPWQMAVIEVIEDARIEALAIRVFPGLQALWACQHSITPDRQNCAGDFLNRLARCLLDPDYRDEDSWIAHGRILFAQALSRLEDNQISWDIGVALAHEFRERKLSYRIRTDLLEVPYRDDNRYLWEFAGFDPDEAARVGYESQQQVRKYVSLMEMVNEVDNELAGEDAQEIWVLPTEFYLDQEGVTINRLMGRDPISPPYHYHEWDYQIQLERPAWVTVQEKRPGFGDLTLVDDIVVTHRLLISRMKFVLDALQPQGVQRIRRLEEGDEIDLNAAIEASIALRMGIPPEERIMLRSVRKTRDIAVLVLLDLSESTNEVVTGQPHTVLELTRAACVLLADAIDKVGDPFALHGFCSDGRHKVDYYRFKDFAQPYDASSKARLAGMGGQLSTRMGAALRHATHHLKQQKSARKLLLVITDGEPADVDVRDPQYLRHDAKKAVEEAGRAGIIPFCMSLDLRADQYVAQIFGARNFMVVDQVARLPEKLPLVYAGLTR